MLKILIKNLTKSMKQFNIDIEDINTFNAKIVNELNEVQNLNRSIENYIIVIAEKYGINHSDIYRLNGQIWDVIYNFRFNHPKFMISLRSNSNKI